MRTAVRTQHPLQEWPGDGPAPLGVQTHEWLPACQRLHTWMSTYVGPRSSQVQGQLQDLVVLEQWSAAIATPPIWTAHMGLARPQDLGTEFIRQVLSESQRMWLAHTRALEGLIKARVGPRGTMVWALRELQRLDTQPSLLAFSRMQDNPSHCLLVTAPSAHHITPHHATPHHITLHLMTSPHLHHITSHHITPHITSCITAHHMTHCILHRVTHWRLLVSICRRL